MQVTDVNVRLLGKGVTLAYADVEFDKAFTSKGWRVFAGRDGRDYDLGLPAEPDKTGKKDEKTGQIKWWPTVWIDPRTDEGKKLMDHIKEKVFARYEAKLNEGKPAGGATSKESPKARDFNDDDIPF